MAPSHDIRLLLAVLAPLIGAGLVMAAAKRPNLRETCSFFAAASLNFMTFNRFLAPDPTVGQVFVLFIMGLAAAEIAIALSIVIAVYRNYRSIKPKEVSELNG